MSFGDALLYIKGLNEGEKERSKARLALAYRHMTWMRSDPDKIPPLKEIIDEVEPEKEQTPQDMFSVVQELHKRFGGGE